MDGLIAAANIEHLAKLLATETDEERRRSIRQLLNEEKANLAAANAKAAEKKKA